VRPTLPSNEHERLRHLGALMVLDTPPEPMFDALAHQAAQLCQAPVAFVSLIDEHRQWLKARHGMQGADSRPREQAICAHTILQDRLLEVPDATQDVRFRDLASTRRDRLRFYAGMPLQLSEGIHVGTLCVFDHAQRQLDAQQRAGLHALAELVVHALRMRRDLLLQTQAVRERCAQALADSEARFHAVTEDQTELVSQSRPDGTLLYVNPAYARFFGSTPAQMVGTNLYDQVEPADRNLVQAEFTRAVQEGRGRATENRVRVPGSHQDHWVSWINTLQADPHGGGLIVHSVGRDVTERRRAEEARAASEEFVRTITDALPVRVTYLDTDLRFRFVNRLYCEEKGLPREAILGRTYRELFGQPRMEDMHTFAAAVLSGQRQRFEVDDVVQGQPRRFEVQLIPDRGDDGALRGVFATAVDMTERCAAENAQRALTNTLQAITEAIPAIVGVVGPDERYRFVNAACARWVGHPREQLVGRSMAEILGPQVYADSRSEIRRALSGESVSFEREAPARRGSSSHLAISYSPLFQPGGAVDGIVVLVQDISDHKREAVRLLRLAQRDALTGVLNRAGFEAFLEQRMAETLGPSLGVLYVDLDRFKPINDTYGHPLGDRVLQECAHRMTHLVRPTDAVARLGGDEFAVVLCGLVDARHARRVAEKIVDAMRLPFEIDGHVLQIGASVGVAHGAKAEDGWQGLVARADRMMYLAKQGGRGQQAAE